MELTMPDINSTSFSKPLYISIPMCMEQVHEQQSQGTLRSIMETQLSFVTCAQLPDTAIAPDESSEMGGLKRR